MMQFFFEEQLTPEKTEEVVAFLKVNGACIEQYPQWLRLGGSQDARRFVLAHQGEGRLCGFCIVHESGRMFRSAQIHFGPVIAPDISYYDFLSEVIGFYTKEGFSGMTIRLAEPVSPRTELASYLLHKNFGASELYDKDVNWTSLQVLLEDVPENIIRGFSKGHKSAIRRAQKEGLIVEKATDQTLAQFAAVYREMYRSRGKELELEAVQKEFREIDELFRQLSVGEIFVVKDKAGEVIGGLMIIFRGDQVRYFKSASHPNSRSLPVLHLGIYEAMCYAREKGKRIFDLWGYNHLVDDKDQRYQINKFKKGFSDDYVFYAKPIEIVLSPWKKTMQTTISRVKRAVKP